jgi:hypothetical protein
VERDELRKSVHNNQNSSITPSGSNQGTHEINEDSFHGPRRRLGTVKTNLRSLGRLGPLTQLALSDILKNLTAHFRRKEIYSHLPQGFERPQMTRKYGIMIIM